MSLTGKRNKLEPGVGRVPHTKAIGASQGRNYWKEPNIESNKEGVAPDYILSAYEGDLGISKLAWSRGECSAFWRWSETSSVHRHCCAVDLPSACLNPMVSEQPALQMSVYEVVSVS